ncbi:hypothetical protein GQ53DRAFT_546723 [Thozetella sp. PMI_491]|nr:hypothetical protein GQ53DRAFT_546723 [Thozetella sp. PMI_491]
MTTISPQSPGHATANRASNKRSHPGGRPQGMPSLACKRCRLRKVKCDCQYPVCTGCLKARVPCIVADQSASREYTQAEVSELEERVADLEAILSEAAASVPEPADMTCVSTPNAPESQNRPPKGSAPRYVGREVGVDFFQPILEALRNQSPINLSQYFAPQSQISSIEYHHPHPLPPRDDALSCIMEYLEWFHVAHPFLDPDDVVALFGTIYNPDEESGSPTATESSRQSGHQLFRANMVLAIGSINLFRNSCLRLHPFGYFTAALRASPPSGWNFGSIEDIENFLLIAHFGVYYNIGCSIWELGRLCMRMCMELRLHRPDLDNMDEVSPEDQRRRRVFWESYMVDRFSSLTLGRPFAINDASIRTPRPESQLPSQNSLPGDWPQLVSGIDIRVFNHELELAQIASRIRYSLQTGRTTASQPKTSVLSSLSPSNSTMGPEEIFELLRHSHGELQSWRDSIPVYAQPRCLYETEEYFEFNYQREKLSLIRVAIDRSPTRGLLPPDYLLRPCLSTACSVIRIFSGLRDRGLIPYTRAYAHTIFTTSLIIVFLLFSQVQAPPGQPDRGPSFTSLVDLESWWSILLEEDVPQSQQEAFEVLSTAEGLMLWFSSKMPDTGNYAHFLAVLKQELGRKLTNGLQPSLLTTEQPQLTFASLHSSVGDMPFAISDACDQFGEDGILGNIFQSENIINSGTYDLMASLWPFSQISGFENINMDLSGYEWEPPANWGISPDTA